MSSQQHNMLEEVYIKSVVNCTAFFIGRQKKKTRDAKPYHQLHQSHSPGRLPLALSSPIVPVLELVLELAA